MRIFDLKTRLCSNLSLELLDDGTSEVRGSCRPAHVGSPNFALVDHAKGCAGNAVGEVIETGEEVIL